MTVHVLFNRLPQIRAALPAAVGAVVQATCARILSATKLSMTGAKHGRAYRKGRIGKRMTNAYRAAGLKAYRTAGGREMAIVGYKFHRASAPGEAPAIDTGYLANSYQMQMTTPMTGIVYTNAEYAAALEFGGARLAARPALGPAAEAERTHYHAAVERALRQI